MAAVKGREGGEFEDGAGAGSSEVDEHGGGRRGIGCVAEGGGRRRRGRISEAAPWRSDKRRNKRTKKRRKKRRTMSGMKGAASSSRRPRSSGKADRPLEPHDGRVAGDSAGRVAVAAAAAQIWVKSASLVKAASERRMMGRRGRGAWRLQPRWVPQRRKRGGGQRERGSAREAPRERRRERGGVAEGGGRGLEVAGHQSREDQS